jgi:DHA2 family multidrug resistance protein
MAGGLAASVDDSSWVLTSYLVANAIVLPISGWLSVRFGRKRFYMASVLVFTISSFLCGIAPSLGMLIVFRVIQGAGGGGLQPVSQAILKDIPGRATGHRLRTVRDGRGTCACDRPHHRRLDHR